jgi:hypothetical protein
MRTQLQPAAFAKAARDLGERFVAALASKDADTMASLFAAEVDFRAMTPGRNWEAQTPAAVAGEVILGTWFDASDVIERVQSVDTAVVVGERCRLGYRLLVSNPAGRFVVEQQAFLDLTDGKITWMRILCSGYRPTAGQP